MRLKSFNKKFNKIMFSIHHTIIFLIILIIFNVFVFSNDFIKAASMESDSYAIKAMRLSQSDGSVTPKSLSFSLESVLDNDLGNIASMGLTYSIEPGSVLFETIEAAALNLENAHVYPNPCKVYAGHTEIIFTDLTAAAVIKIYTISGDLVRRLDKSSITNRIVWDLKNNEGDPVASGIYIYFVKYESMIKKGKIVVIK